MDLFGIALTIMASVLVTDKPETSGRSKHDDTLSKNPTTTQPQQIGGAGTNQPQE